MNSLQTLLEKLRDLNDARGTDYTLAGHQYKSVVLANHTSLLLEIIRVQSEALNKIGHSLTCTHPETPKCSGCDAFEALEQAEKIAEGSGE